MNYRHSVRLMFILASFIFFLNSQCIPSCTLGTYCFTQNNTNGPDTYSCANCSSNCKNCSSQNTCNDCDVGYSYIVPSNDFVISTNPYPASGNCVQCISNCISCATNVTNCDECASGYAWNGASCSSIDNLQVEPNTTPGSTQFNPMYIVAIVGGIIGIGLIATISFYCVAKRREKRFFIYGEPSVRQEMIKEVGKNHFTVYEEPSTRQ